MKKDHISWDEFDAKLYEVFGKKIKKLRRTEDLYFNVVKRVEIGDLAYVDDMETLYHLQDMQEMEGELYVAVGYCFLPGKGPFVVNANEIHDFVKEFYDEYGDTFFSLCDIVIINFEKAVIWVYFHEGMCWLTKGRIDSIEDDQGMFFHELRNIRRWSIYDIMGNLGKYYKEKDILTDVTHDFIIMVMELLDGYVNKSIKCEMMNVKTGNIINSDVEMQDLCIDYLKHSNIY